VGTRHGPTLEGRTSATRPEAISAYQEDLAICRGTGDRHGEGRTLTNLGIVFKEAGWSEEAVGAHQCAAAICRETGDQHLESKVKIDLDETITDETSDSACKPRNMDVTGCRRAVPRPQGSPIERALYHGEITSRDVILAAADYSMRMLEPERQSHGSSIRL
jgi:hypothetical protein